MNWEELKTTSSLAMLELARQEELEAAFAEMIEHFAKMMEIDVDDLQPTTHAILKDNRVRKDAIADRTGEPDSLLECAPEREDRFIKIPSVL